MCYQKCRYEDYEGECTLKSGIKPPMDAICVIADAGADYAKLRELATDMYYVIRRNNTWWDCKSKETKAFHGRLQELGIEVYE